MSVFIQLHPNDDVVIARQQLISGSLIDALPVRGLIPPGHKVAVRSLAAGQAVRRYNQIIGFASRPIEAGEHVHTHNLNMGPDKGDFERDYAIGQDVKPTGAPLQAHFMGIQRPDGRVATRNYIGVLSSVNCSATAARAIADHFSRQNNPQALADFPQVDGVVALTHGTGCGMDNEGLGMRLLERTLAGYARHANFWGVLVVGLGCETNQLNTWLAHSSLSEGEQLKVFNIQDTGGTRQTVEKGIALIRQMLPQANAVARTPCSVEHITVGLQCGGSDGYSGISANPALGAAVDLLVAHGGTAILSETPEIYGAEHLLTRRAISREVSEALLERIRWWEDHARKHGASISNNPSAGNKEGGLTTIFEKSLGAVAKGGQAPLMWVLQYAQTVTGPGLCFMDTPGYDPVSMTGLVAGGCNVGVFTTGRGSVYGCKPAPCLKVSTHTPLYRWMEGDMDLNAGTILDGEESIAQVGQRIFEAILATASGDRTKSEEAGIGDEEFAPWPLGPVF
jgi:altronate hydrolase